MIRNWLGQEIQSGDLVWRGARLGNSSDFKVGRVESVNPEKRTARVHWLAGQGWRAPIVPLDSHGSPTVDSLVVITHQPLPPETWAVIDGAQS